MFTPAGVLGTWFRGLLSIAFVVGAVWLLWSWYDQLPAGPRGPRVRNAETNDADVADSRPADSPAVNPLPGDNGARWTPWERIANWRPGYDKETAMLAAGAFLVFMSLGGRFVSPRLLLPAGEPIPDLGEGTQQHLLLPDGSELHVESFGPANAPPVICSHGWGMNRTEWALLKQQWGDRFRLIVWDLPGLGHSSQPEDRNMSLERFATCLRAVLEATCDRPAVLMGHSIGGMTTLTFCKAFPELLGSRVCGAIIVHSTPRNPLYTMQFSGLMVALQKPVIEPLLSLQIALSPLVSVMNWMSYLNGSTHWSVKSSGFAGAETRAKLDYVARQETIANPAVVARGCFGMLDYDARDALPNLPIPVLAISASDDPITLPQASEVISHTAPMGNLAELKPTKHFGLLELDEPFASTTAEFCERAHAQFTKEALPPVMPTDSELHAAHPQAAH